MIKREGCSLGNLLSFLLGLVLLAGELNTSEKRAKQAEHVWHVFCALKGSDKAARAYMIEHDGKQLADSAGRLGATNNEMEMTAFLESLKKLEQLRLTQQPLLFVLNSQYCGRTLTGSWPSLIPPS